MNPKKQFVLLDAKGKEVEWIDPIISYRETDVYWIVDNGWRMHVIPKREFPGHKVRFKELIENWEWID